jgi:hypothetical protein
MKNLSANPGSGDIPAIVWLYTPADDKTVQACNANIFQNERVGIALKKFRTYRVNVEEIDNAELRKEYMRAAPAFLFFDPSGDQVAKLGGKKATSLSGFSSVMGKTWNMSFTVKLKPYTKNMTNILDRLDKINGRTQIMEQSKARLDSKPNAMKQRKLQAQAETLRAEKEAVVEDEQEILASVELRSKFRPEEQAALDR